MADELLNNEEQVIINDEDSYNKKINPVPAPSKDMGLDVKQTIVDNIIEAGLNSKLDITQLESFTNLSQNRNQVYQLIDTMSEDPIIAAALETYAEDATETNSFGKIVWCESEDPKVAEFVTFLLEAMRVDKNIYKWVYALCKYGDCYLKLFRESEFVDELFDDEDKAKDKEFSQKQALYENLASLEEEKEAEVLTEEVHLKVFSKNDRYVHYLEMVPNPAEMYELTKFGKSYAYIQANVPITDTKYEDVYFNSRLKYNFKKKDIDLHTATDYVHAALEDNSSRAPEEISIFRTDEDYETNTNGLTYTVRRGQSLLYNTFKIWRELSLLENSLMLNRLTKSSIVRIFNVEVGDMPKENVPPHLAGIKSLIEQKSAIDSGNSISEYVNPGPMENNIYIPQRNGIGSLNVQSVGGDVDVKGIADLDYFKNKLYASLKIPKQFLGDTDDATGFNGGTSLTIISSRYAKTIKRIQNTMIQALTDAINLMLLDKGLSSYISKFELHMQEPTTQEEVDRLSNMQNEIQTYGDILGLLSDIEDPGARLEITKVLISSVVSDSDVLNIVQEQIEKLKESNGLEDEFGDDDLGPGGSHGSFGGGGGVFSDFDDFGDEGSDFGDESDIDTDLGSGEDLPSPADLNLDLTDMGGE